MWFANDSPVLSSWGTTGDVSSTMRCRMVLSLSGAFFPFFAEEGVEAGAAPADDGLGAMAGGPALANGPAPADEGLGMAAGGGPASSGTGPGAAAASPGTLSVGLGAAAGSPACSCDGLGAVAGDPASSDAGLGAAAGGPVSSGTAAGGAVSSGTSLGAAAGAASGAAAGAASEGFGDDLPGISGDLGACLWIDSGKDGAESCSPAASMVRCASGAGAGKSPASLPGIRLGSGPVLDSAAGCDSGTGADSEFDSGDSALSSALVESCSGSS